jgi:hypothetical protein
MEFGQSAINSPVGPILKNLKSGRSGQNGTPKIS